VVKWTPLDSRHLRTGNSKHLVKGRPLEMPAALAICHDADGDAYYLFYCDADWNVLTDTFHEGMEGAMAQAEFEFTGVNATWQAAT